MAGVPPREYLLKYRQIGCGALSMVLTRAISIAAYEEGSGIDATGVNSSSLNQISAVVPLSDGQLRRYMFGSLLYSARPRIEHVSPVVVMAVCPNSYLNICSPLWPAMVIQSAGFMHKKTRRSGSLSMGYYFFPLASAIC